MYYFNFLKLTVLVYILCVGEFSLTTFFSGLRPNLRPKDPLSVTQLKFPVVSREGKLLFTLGHTTITFLILSLTAATNTVFSYGTYLFTSNFDFICRYIVVGEKIMVLCKNPCFSYSALNFFVDKGLKREVGPIRL